MKKYLLLSLILCNVSYAAGIKEYVKSNSIIKESETKQLYPFVYLDLKTELFYDRISGLQEEGGAQNYLTTESSLLIDLNLTKFFAISSEFGLEKVKGFQLNPVAFGNTEKEPLLYGTTLTAKELSLKFTFDRVKFNVGKFSAHFAGGSERWSDYFYDSWYGIGGTQMNQAYALDEKLGIKINVGAVERESVKINVEGAFFTNDNTTLFKKPFFLERQTTGFTTPSGGKRMAGSEKPLKSYVISTQGFIGLNRRNALSFGLGYKKQASDFGIYESGNSATVQYTITLFDDLEISSFLEGVKIRNAYAIEGFSERYLTSSLSTSFAGIRLGLVKNQYNGELNSIENKIKFTEYFLGFEVPKTELGFYIAKKVYSYDSSLSGFSMNVRYRIH